MRWSFQTSSLLLLSPFSLLSMSTVQLICFSLSLLVHRREGPTILPKLHEGSIASCHMSEDAKLLVTGGYDLRVILWDLESMTHKLVLRVRRMSISSPPECHFCLRRDIAIGLTMSVSPVIINGLSLCRMWVNRAMFMFEACLSNRIVIFDCGTSRIVIILNKWSNSTKHRRMPRSSVWVRETVVWTSCIPLISSQCSKCGKNFSSSKVKRDKSDASSSMLLCVFCRLDQKHKHTTHDDSLADYDRATALNEQSHHKLNGAENTTQHH